MRIIAYQTSIRDNRILLEESTGEYCLSANLEELFSFLLEDYDKAIRVCWNLDATVAPLLKLVGKLRCERLHRINKLYLAPFNIFYVSGKVFSVTHIPSKDNCSLYELQQYFPELDAPETLKEVEQLGTLLMQTLKRMNLYPTKLSSPVKIYEECVLNHLSLPTVENIPEEASLFAAQCSGKLWIEAYQLGYWE